MKLSSYFLQSLFISAVQKSLNAHVLLKAHAHTYTHATCECVLSRQKSLLHFPSTSVLFTSVRPRDRIGPVSNAGERDGRKTGETSEFATARKFPLCPSPSPPLAKTGNIRGCHSSSRPPYLLPREGFVTAYQCHSFGFGGTLQLPRRALDIDS